MSKRQSPIRIGLEKILQQLFAKNDSNSGSGPNGPASTPPEDKSRPPGEEMQSPENQASSDEESSPGLSQHPGDYWQNRVDLLIKYWWGALGIGIVIGIAYINESFAYTETTPWWADLFISINQGWGILWGSFRVTTVLIILFLIFILVGPPKLYAVLITTSKWFIIRWRWLIFLLLGVVLFIFLILPIYNNANSWVFLPVEDGVGDLNQDAIAAALRTNINTIGVDPNKAITLSVPDKPNIQLEEFPDQEQCLQQILKVPTFSPGETLAFGTSRNVAAGVDSGGGQQLSVSTVVGSINLPLEQIIRFTLREFAPKYREFNIQLMATNRSTITGPIITDTLHIVVKDDHAGSWTVESSHKNLPHMINYLSYQIQIRYHDDHPSNKATDKIEPFFLQVNNSNLAMALGNQAFRNEDFEEAIAYYLIAEWFNNNADAPIIQEMLGLALTRLSLEVTGKVTQNLQNEARAAFTRAISLGKDNEEIYAYLTCIDRYLFRNVTSARDNFEIYKQLREARLEQDQATARQVRITELQIKEPLGPGRYISSVKREDDSFGLYYIIGDSKIYSGTFKHESQAYIPAPIKLVQDDIARQIFAVKQGIYYLTTDGLVKFLRTDTLTTTTILGSEELSFSSQDDVQSEKGAVIIETGGIRQIFVEENHLFLVDSFGRILRLPPNDSPQPFVPNTAIFAEHDARQIYLDGNTLYLLKEDGTVWRISDAFGGDLKNAQQIVSDIDNREIVVANGTVYMLRINGNIWRYDDREPEVNRLIDAGIQTKQIRFDPHNPQELFVLKNDGRVWLIRNPTNPTEGDLVGVIDSPANRIAIHIIDPRLITLIRNEDGTVSIDPSRQIPKPATPIPTPTSTLTPTATLEPTPTSIPTNTPIPSPTPVPSTTPIPTNTPIPTPILIRVGVLDGNDDAEERLTDPTFGIDQGKVYLSSSDLELTYDSDTTNNEASPRGPQIVGLRFREVPLPAEARVTRAFIEFVADEKTNREETIVTIYGEAQNNAPTFSDEIGNISNRVKTEANVVWALSPWETADEKHQTPNLSSIVQEIISLEEWEFGNPIVFLIEGSGEETETEFRQAKSSETGVANAPSLIIEYTVKSQDQK